MVEQSKFEIALEKLDALDDFDENRHEYIEAVNAAENWNDLLILVQDLVPYGGDEVAACLAKAKALVEAKPPDEDDLEIINDIAYELYDEDDFSKYIYSLYVETEG